MKINKKLTLLLLTALCSNNVYAQGDQQESYYSKALTKTADAGRWLASRAYSTTNSFIDKTSQLTEALSEGTKAALKFGGLGIMAAYCDPTISQDAQMNFGQYVTELTEKIPAPERIPLKVLTNAVKAAALAGAAAGMFIIDQYLTENFGITTAGLEISFAYATIMNLSANLSTMATSQCKTIEDKPRYIEVG